MYAGWAVLVLRSLDLARRGHPFPWGRTWFLLFALLLTPANLLAYRDVSYQGVEKSLVLAAMLLLALLVPLPEGTPENELTLEPAH